MDESKSKTVLDTTSATSKTTLKLRPTKITHIYKNEKSLTTIPKLADTKDVLVLYLHNNFIEKIENLEPYKKLTHLYLQWNNIRNIENLTPLKYLKKLYLGHNKISVVEKLEGLTKLKELHIEKQNLESGETIAFEPRCLEALSTRLTVLNISDNKICDLDDISQLEKLSILIANNNKLENFMAVAENISKLIHLRDVHFHGNPMCDKHRYKETIIAKCYKLETIDGRSVTDSTRIFMKYFDEKRNSMQTLKTINEAKNISSQQSCHDSLFSDSPNAHLMQLEAQRSAAARARQLRLKQLDCSNGQIPRCFWRNKDSSKDKKKELQQDSNLTLKTDVTGLLWP